MKVEGLGDDRRAALYQIETLVREVDQFTEDIFSKMVDDYKKNDPVVGKILEESKQIADSNYTRYLNRFLVGNKMGFSELSFDHESENGTILGKAMAEMRDKLKNENDYRKQFLGPQIGKQAQVHDIQMRRVQKDEIKIQRQESKALANSGRKEKGFFNFGR